MSSIKGDIQTTWEALWRTFAARGIPEQDRDDLVQDAMLRSLQRGPQGGSTVGPEDVRTDAESARRSYWRGRARATARTCAWELAAGDVQPDDVPPDRAAYARETLRRFLEALTPGERAGIIAWARGGPKPKIRMEKLRGLLDEFGDAWVKVAILSALGVTWTKSASAGLGAAVALLVLLPASVALAPREFLWLETDRREPPLVVESARQQPAASPPRRPVDTALTGPVTAPPRAQREARVAGPTSAPAPGPSAPDLASASERRERIVDDLYATMLLAAVDPAAARRVLARIDRAPASTRDRLRAERAYLAFLLATHDRSLAEACRGPGAAGLRAGGNLALAGAVRLRCAGGPP